MHTPPLILIADDEVDTASLLQKICQDSGWATIMSDNGNNTVQFAKTHLPDLILLDVRMPYKNGFEVLAELRQQAVTQHIPVIMVTATATAPEEAVKGINLGADDYLPKPFHYKELQARIRAKLRARELEEKLFKRTMELGMLVDLGIKLNNSHALPIQAQSVLKFLIEHMDADAGLLHFLPSTATPRLTIIDTGEEVYKANDMAALDAYVHPDAPPQRLNTIQTQMLFKLEAFHSAILITLNQHMVGIGILCLAHRSVGYFDDQALMALRSVAEQVSLGAVNAQLYQALRSNADDLAHKVEERTTALEVTQRQLIRSEKLAALGRLAGEIAHEINNPLQPIMSCLESAIEDLEDQQPVSLQDLKMAMSEVARLKRMVSRLLDFARPDSSQRTGVQINEIIEEVLALTAKKMALIGVHIQREMEMLPAINVNPDQLKQVILNLIINSIDAMNDSPQKQLLIRTWADNIWVTIIIEDQGKGIESHLLQEIFEPFFSTKDHGSGLGLAITHSIIMAHNGTIDVRSEVNKGTIFTICLPIQ